MATIINTPNGNGTTDNSGGWAVAVIILLIVVVAGLFFWMRGRSPEAADTHPGATVQVNLPASGGTNAGGSGSAPATQ